MDIGVNKKYTGVMLFLALGFFVLGLGLTILTWQNLRQQQEHILDQLEVTARAIIRSVEASLYRGIFRGMGPGRWTEQSEFTDLARDVLEELVAEGDVVFLEISGARGRLFISSLEGASDLFQPTESMLEQARTGTWAETSRFMDKDVFIMGVQARRMEMMSRTRRPVHDDSESLSERQGTIFIALDMSDYLDVYSGFKRTIIFQNIFILGGILLFWALLMAFLRRREQGQKFIQLKSFHSRLLDNMPDGLLSIDQEQIVTAANPAARDILRAGPEIVGQSLSKIMPRNLDIRSGRNWTQIDLDAKSLEILILPIKEEKQSLVLIRDRTRMKELERDLEHSRDLATLGRFAAGLAHEIRNPLSSLKGFAQYFLQKFNYDDPAHSYAKTMVLESDRLNRVVTDLLFLARPRPISPVMVDLEQLFQEIIDLLRSDLEAKRCAITTDVAQPSVRADRDLLKQALINLILNSLNAVENNKGQISIRSRMTGGMVEIILTDNGYGMDAQTRERAMEPFFSVRESGTGLGLAIVQRIVRDHKGRILIDSSPETGTRVSLLFPDTQEVVGNEQ